MYTMTELSLTASIVPSGAVSRAWMAQKVRCDHVRRSSCP